MKSIIKSLLILFILIVTKTTFAEDVSFSNGTYQEILDMAKQQNKIVMIDFVTDWCKWCVETDRKVYTNGDVSAFANEHQINWKIDAEKGEGPDLAKKYGVKGFPTIVFASSDGTEIDRIYGYLPAEQFIVKMKDYNNGVNTLGAIKKMLEADPNDPVANYLMADKMTSNGLEGDVKIYLEKTISMDPANDKGYTDDAKFMLAYVKEDPVTIQSLINEYPNSEKVKDAYLNLAGYYTEKEDLAKTEQIYSEAFAKFGKNDFDVMQSYGGYLLGVGYQTMKNEKSTVEQRNEAIKTLEKCLLYVNGTVNEASAYFIMSDLYLQNKNIDKANECIDMAIKIYDKKAYQDQKLKINKQEATK
ncbi:MAG TPA: thioredoxin fold domain-containing protein [Ignavibacteria bacterium]|nr:thioredoxin fold domain-containing protein [Ignavibacteria bacterium]